MTFLLAVSDKYSAFRNVVLSVIGLIVSSKLIVPLYPVPITLQMLAVYYIGLMLSPREAFASIFAWLFLGGACGLPVFASAFGGISGPSAGYLIGMLLGCPVVSFAIKKGSSPVVACIYCYIITHIVGCIWLSSFMRLNEVVYLGVLPFLIPEFFKMTIASAIFLKSRS